MNRLVCLLILWASLWVGVPVTPPQTRPSPQMPEPDQARLNGFWIPVEAIDDGHVLSPDELHRSFLEVQGGQYILRTVSDGEMRRAIAEPEYELKLGPRRTPKALDLARVDLRRIPEAVVERARRAGARLDEHLEGIYELSPDGNRLRVCLGARRPMEFGAPAGSGREYWTFQRFGTPVAPGAAAELARLAGMWVPVEEIYNGKPLAAEGVEPRLLVVQGDQFILRPFTKDGHPDPDGDVVGLMALDLGRTPNAFDVVWLDGVDDVRWKMEAIYRLEGDRLTICMAPRRPTEFAAPAGSAQIYSVYKRAAYPKADPRRAFGVDQ